MGSSAKHLIPLPKDTKAEPAWAGELKDLLSRLVDLAVSLVSSQKRGLVLENILTPEELSERLNFRYLRFTKLRGLVGSRPSEWASIGGLTLMF